MTQTSQTTEQAGATIEPGRWLRSIIIKTGLLFVIFNVLYMVAQPLPLINRMTLYNGLFPGRERFPWSEQPNQSYSVSLPYLDALFASHRLAGTPKSPGEYRVVFLGDSSIWGLEVPADGTLPACLDRLGLKMNDGRTIRAYNLAYPAPNALRDILILRRALDYAPDLIIWPITLRSLNRSEFPLSDIIHAQADESIALAKSAGFDLPVPASTLWDRTLFAQRGALAAWFQHQLQGFGWRVTRVDYGPREFVTPPQYDLAASRSYDMSPQAVAWETLPLGISIAQGRGVPVLLFNEPIFISKGENSTIRYNADYPRGAYDAYRAHLAELATSGGWHYLDLWDAVPPEQFIRTALHYTPAAACMLAKDIGARIIMGS